MVSDPRIQAAYHIFSPTRPPEDDPVALVKWAEECRAWARLAEREDYGLSEDDWAMFSNGTQRRRKK